MEQVLEFLDRIDKDLLLYLHRQNSPLLDIIWVGITEKYNWIPLYVVLILALIRQFGWQAVYSIAAVILLVVISDQLTSSLMKPFFGRFRPCHDPEIGHFIRIIRRCGGEFGFVSSHAANSFSVSTFYILLFRQRNRYIWWLLIWPILFSYSRIYLGVHYPLDVLCGAVVGMLLGWMVYAGTKILSKKVPFEFTPGDGKA